jgi:hypothetical protein
MLQFSKPLLKNWMEFVTLPKLNSLPFKHLGTPSSKMRKNKTEPEPQTDLMMLRLPLKSLMIRSTGSPEKETIPSSIRNLRSSTTFKLNSMMLRLR